MNIFDRVIAPYKNTYPIYTTHEPVPMPYEDDDTHYEKDQPFWTKRKRVYPPYGWIKVDMDKWLDVFDEIKRRK